MTQNGILKPNHRNPASDIAGYRCFAHLAMSKQKSLGVSSQWEKLGFDLIKKHRRLEQDTGSRGSLVPVLPGRGFCYGENNYAREGVERDNEICLPGCDHFQVRGQRMHFVQNIKFRDISKAALKFLSQRGISCDHLKTPG